MKKRIPILLLVTLLLFVAWWLQLTSARNPTRATTASKPVETERSAPMATEPVAVPQPASEEAYKAKRLAEILARGRSSNQPISFYGKVIDQHGEPIPDVKITLGLRTFKEPAPGVMGDADVSLVRTTNAEGRFEITDVKGSVLEMRALEKPGYEASTAGIYRGSYRYWAHPSEGPYRPNTDAPEIFRMWRQQGAETLVRKGISVALRADGTPSNVDLLTGRAASPGDIRVMLVRNPQQITYGQRNYEWTLTVESVDGGLLESKEEQMFLAPEGGYQSKMVIHMPADAAEWTDVKSFNLYVKLRGGKQYGRAELKAVVGAPRETTPFYITSFVNPSGSRNLEYDPAQGLGREPGSNPLRAKPTP